jgi:CDP-glucose 4,6-dehydratase
LSQRFQSLKGKKVFVTGHTGFTGSWVSIWLNQLGCEVFGYSLEPETAPNLFTEAKIRELVSGKIADIRDFETLRDAIAKFQPDLVLHLAAQPLVRRSYRIPRETFEINAQGTANVLDAVRGLPSVKGILCITTDKVYKNQETGRRYIESDELGGVDPYSASKAAAEHVIASFRYLLRQSGCAFPIVSVARGGNIIGGGDWSEDRLIPDFIRARELKRSLEVRNPLSTRPWQHVVSLIDGYLSILDGILGDRPEIFDRAFNLGPIVEDSVTVAQMLSILGEQIPDVEVVEKRSILHEAGKLSLDSELASRVFGWNPRWDNSMAIRMTTEWYKQHSLHSYSAHELCSHQIRVWEDSSFDSGYKSNLL